MSYPPLIDLKNGFWPVVHLQYGVSEWNFTDMLTIKGYILWVRIVTLTFPDCELSTLDWSENWFLTCSSFQNRAHCFWSITWVFMHRIFSNFAYILLLGMSGMGLLMGKIRPFSMELLPFLPLKNGFWPVILLLFMISEWNFTDMLNSKGYILQWRTNTLTFPVHELSALD